MWQYSVIHPRRSITLVTSRVARPRFGRRRWLSAGVLLLLAGATLLAGRHLWLASQKPGNPSTELTQEDWYARAIGEIGRAEYSASMTPHGLQAPNRAQDIRTWFRNDRRIEITRRTASPGEAPPLWAWRTAAVGRLGSMEPLAPTPPEPCGKRVEYRHSSLIEWYENRPEGLEQGFTLSRRPPGEGPLRLEGTVTTALRAVLVPDEKGVAFYDDDGHEILRYAGLKVHDARDSEVPAAFALAEGGLAMIVDDRDARYPLLVDPLLTNAAWGGIGDQAGAQYGYAVGTAGDVNGDGYSDVLVSAPRYDNGESDEGRASLYLGSPSGLAVTPAWTAESDQAGALFGKSVATAGDVNGDGFHDVVIGADSLDAGQTNEGAVYVWYGSASGLGANGTPANADWSAQSDQSNARLGVAVATAGDVNGDGFADLAVGASFYDNGEANEGEVFVWYGGAGGLGANGTPANADWLAESNQANAHLGAAVATAGDVNANGFDDLLVGAPEYDNPLVDEGIVFLWLGASAGLGANGTPANRDWQAETDVAGATTGTAVATAGDVDADGYADVIIGADRATNGQVSEGIAMVWLGGPGGLGAFGTLLNIDWGAESNQVNALFGHAVAAAGDVNGDGFGDVMVGGPQYAGGGGAWVWYGGPSDLGANGTPSNADWEITDVHAGRQLGWSLATAGDVDGNGLNDVLVSRRLYNDVGRVDLYEGMPGNLFPLPTWSRTETQDHSHFGEGLAGTGDVNGDGYSDLIIGAPRYDNGQSREGLVFVYYGRAGAMPPVTPDWTAESNQIDEELGTSVGTAGDVNGDGYSDIVVGAPFFANGQTDEGGVFVWYGSATGLGPNGTLQNADWRSESNAENSWFGTRVGTVGDVNGDGYSEVFGVAFYYTDPEEQEGGVFVWYGGPGGLGPDGTPQNADWRGEGNAPNAAFGSAASTAGDVNGDGYSDFLVGAFGYDVTLPSPCGGGCGAAFVYYGGPQGLGPDGIPQNADWVEEGPADPFGTFAGDVADAGDVNGDGFSDVIIAAAFHTTLVDREGAAYVYHGSASGLGATPAWTGTSPVLRGRYGASVASAGDVNRDGYSDVIVGAYRFIPGNLGPGAAYGYLGSPLGLATDPVWTVSTADPDSSHFGEKLAGAGDLNGDGYGDVVVAALNQRSGVIYGGAVFVYYGNEAGFNLPPSLPRQARVDDLSPIDVLGISDAETAFRLKLLGRTVAGRGGVAMEYEVEPLGTPIDGTGVVRGTFVDTSPAVSGGAAALSEVASGLLPGTPYKWRLRTVTDSPFFPHSRWFAFPYNGLGDWDLRTAGQPVAIDEQSGSPAATLRLEPAHPNPFNPITTIRYVLPARSRVTLDIFDASGRHVTTIVDQVEGPGERAVTWDGRDVAGRPASTGIYFAELRALGEVRSIKLALVK